MASEKESKAVSRYCSITSRLSIKRPNRKTMQISYKRVKSCYKIKIDSRVQICCFYGVMMCKQHQCLTIVPLLSYNSATIRL